MSTPADNRQSQHPMTLTQKILAAHAVGLHAAVGAGRRHPADPRRLDHRQRAGLERHGPHLRAARAARRSHDRDRFFLAVDHTVDPTTLANDARTQKLAQLSRDFAKESGIKHFYDANQTILHTKFYRDLVQPGEVVLGADSHTSLARRPGRVRHRPRRRRHHRGDGARARRGSRCPRPSPSSTQGELPFGIGGKDVILRTLGALGRNTVAMERTRRVSRRRGAQLLDRHALHHRQHDRRVRRANGIFEADERGRGLAGARRDGYNDSRALLPRRRRRALRRALPDRPRELGAAGGQALLARQRASTSTELAGQRARRRFIGACTTTEEELVLGALVLEAALRRRRDARRDAAEARSWCRAICGSSSTCASAGLWAIYERAGFTRRPARLLDVPGRRQPQGRQGRGLAQSRRTATSRTAWARARWPGSPRRRPWPPRALGMQVDRSAPAARARRSRPLRRSCSAASDRARCRRSAPAEPEVAVAARAGAAQATARRAAARRVRGRGAALRRRRRHRRDHPRRVLPPDQARGAGRQVLPLRAPRVRERARERARPSWSPARAGAAAARASRRCGRCRAPASRRSSRGATPSSTSATWSTRRCRTWSSRTTRSTSWRARAPSWRSTSPAASCAMSRRGRRSRRRCRRG